MLCIFAYIIVYCSIWYVNMHVCTTPFYWYTHDIYTYITYISDDDRTQLWVTAFFVALGMGHIRQIPRSIQISTCRGPIFGHINSFGFLVSGSCCFACLSIHPSIHLSIYLSIYLWDMCLNCLSYQQDLRDPFTLRGCRRCISLSSKENMWQICRWSFCQDDKSVYLVQDDEVWVWLQKDNCFVLFCAFVYIYTHPRKLLSFVDSTQQPLISSFICID